MLRVITVEDDTRSIWSLEQMLKNFDYVEVIANYTNCTTALEKMIALTPDLIFLDMDMVQSSGTKMVEMIQKRLPNCHIVFVTGYRDFAVDSFELGITDYILKPINLERLQKLMDRIKKDTLYLNHTDEYYVCSFQYFRFKKNGKEIKDVKWSTRKAKELFIYLLQNKGRMVRKDVLIKLLWSNFKVSNAYESLYSTIYRVRKALEQADIHIEIISTDQGYKLELNDVKYDVEEWEEGVRYVGKECDDHFFQCKRIMNLYTGDYLAKEIYAWKENEQERLKVLYIDKMMFLIDHLTNQRQYEEAIVMSLHFQKMYPYMDYSYFSLMKLYDKFDEFYMVEQQYKRLAEILKNKFGILPSENINHWYEQWTEQQYLVTE